MLEKVISTQFFILAGYSSNFCAKRLTPWKLSVYLFYSTNSHTRLFERREDAVIPRSEVKAWTEGVSDEHTGNVGRLVVLPATYLEEDGYMRMKMHESIAIFSALGHGYVFFTMTCNSNSFVITDDLLLGKRSDDRPDLCKKVFKLKH